MVLGHHHHPFLFFPSMSMKKGNRKHKIPRSFLDCPSLSLVVDFPSAPHPTPLVSTPVTPDTITEICLDRFIQEIVKPFRRCSRSTEKGGESFVMVNGQLKKKTTKSAVKSKNPRTDDSIWNKRVTMGTNQCLRRLEKNMNDKQDSHPKIQLILLARDIYPPTMLIHVPVIAKRLEIPLLLLPGKASNDMGRAIGVRKTSIVIFSAPNASPSPDDSKMDSFIEFVRSNILTQTPQNI